MNDLTTSSPLAPKQAELLEYLHALPIDAELPAMRDIGKALGCDAYEISGAFVGLAARGRLTTRHGTRSHHRGHRIVRLRDGRVLKTRGCPLEMPA